MSYLRSDVPLNVKNLDECRERSKKKFVIRMVFTRNTFVFWRNIVSIIPGKMCKIRALIIVRNKLAGLNAYAFRVELSTALNDAGRITVK